MGSLVTRRKYSWTTPVPGQGPTVLLRDGKPLDRNLGLRDVEGTVRTGTRVALDQISQHPYSVRPDHPLMCVPVGEWTECCSRTPWYARIHFEPRLYRLTSSTSSRVSRVDPHLSSLSSPSHLTVGVSCTLFSGRARHTGGRTPGSPRTDVHNK